MCRSWSSSLVLVLTLLGREIPAADPPGEKPAAATRIPVILDTDIGGDIDDTWALALLLKSPEFDVKLVVSDTGDTVYRARIIARMLEVAHRTDIPVGVGIRQSTRGGPQAQWVADYDLARYPGKVFEDGVAAIVETITSAPRPVSLICIGAMPNIKAALERSPGIARGEIRRDVWQRAARLRRQIQARSGGQRRLDTVAIHLARSQEWLRMEELPIVISDDGFTRIDPRGKRVRLRDGVE